MTLEEAIAHLDESLGDKNRDWGCEECKQEHMQLREWLIELKERRAAAEAIRCRDCKHWNRCYVSGEWPDKITCNCKITQHYTSNGWTRFTDPDDYCSFAERR